jgi:hypothetical protein
MDRRCLRRPADLTLPRRTGGISGLSILRYMYRLPLVMNRSFPEARKGSKAEEARYFRTGSVMEYTERLGREMQLFLVKSAVRSNKELTNTNSENVTTRPSFLRRCRKKRSGLFNPIFSQVGFTVLTISYPDRINSFVKKTRWDHYRRVCLQ